MSKVSGVLEKAYRNDRGYYSVKVGETWYGTFKDNYAELEGNNVTFEAEQKGKFWNVKGPIAVDESKQSASSSPNAASVPAGDRQQSIVLQSSYKTAAEVLGDMLAAEMLTIPAKKADKYDAYLGLLDELATHIYRNCIDPVAFLDGTEAPGPAGDEGGKYNPVEA